MISWLQQIKPGPSFTSWNMRAILDGRKIQTRRIIDLDPDLYKVWGKTHVKGRGVGVEVEQGGELFVHSYASYQPGELYYIREPVHRFAHETRYSADNKFVMTLHQNITHPLAHPVPRWENEDGSERKVDKLSAYCMPRRCARRFSLIQGVWVERVQDIGYEDVIAEGIPEKEILSHCPSPVALPPECGEQEADQVLDVVARQMFQTRWVDIHSEKLWELNPWVFAYEFEVMNREQAEQHVMDKEAA